MNLFRPFSALSNPFLSTGSASLYPWLLSCRRSAAEKVNDIMRPAGNNSGRIVFWESHAMPIMTMGFLFLG